MNIAGLQPSQFIYPRKNYQRLWIGLTQTVCQPLIQFQLMLLKATLSFWTGTQGVFHGEKVRAGLVFNETIKVIFRGLERFYGQMIIKPKGKIKGILKFNIDNIHAF